MKQKADSSKCDSPNCMGKAQAVCFKCAKLFCFQCSLTHAQQNSSKLHTMSEIEQASNTIEKQSKQLLQRVHSIRIQGGKSVNQSSKQTQKLHPQRFQQQLDQISFMKKQTLKVVEKFYSQISLQLVNMWQYYLKKYSGIEQTLQHLSQLQIKLAQYATARHTHDYVRGFIRSDFERDVRICHDKIAHRDRVETPRCPTIRIDDRVLVELSQVLCSSINTINYTTQEEHKDVIRIHRPDTLLENVKEVPIFPIKKPHCYLFDLKQKTYEIQQFNNLDYLPDNPKSIVIPNGDIHIIGGVKKKDTVLNTHLVFRSTSSEVFKLSDLPYAVSPSNSLVYCAKFIYLIGGMLELHQWTKKCLKYNLQLKQWQEIAPMQHPKPHQSTAVFHDSIYCFGISQNKKINIEKYTIERNQWEDINIKNFLSNPFNFACGFTTLQINDDEILFMGGKKFLENVLNNKRSTDREISGNLYLFRPETNSFVQLGKLSPSLGVQYGQFSPIVFGGNIYFCQFLLSKNNPIARWYDNLHVLQLSSNGVLQSIAILNEQ